MGSFGKTYIRALTRPVVDVLNHNPLTRSVKNFRNRAFDTYFRSRKAPGTDAFIAELRCAVDGDTAQDGICFTIAYNTPWAIEELTGLWQKFSSGMALAIIDNSSDTQKRAEIARICRDAGVPCLALPPNPEWSPNRSHALALNWTFHNVIRHVRPKIFGFLDHDCFPVAEFSIPERIRGKAVYGSRNGSPKDPEKWSLWAGFCFFDFDRAGDLPLDFIHRVEWGLDTGGGNWPVLYRNLGEQDIAATPNAHKATEANGIPLSYLVIDGAFVHFGGASYLERYDRQAYVSAIHAHLKTLTAGA